jgi:hypothetical protein
MIPLDAAVGDRVWIFPEILGLFSGVASAVIVQCDTIKRTSISALMWFVSGIVTILALAWTEIILSIAVFMYRNANQNVLEPMGFDKMWFPYHGTISFTRAAVTVFIISTLVLTVINYLRSRKTPTN